MWCSSVAKRFKEKYSDLIDTKIYDSRRLCKLAYSLSVYDNKLYVCYPINMYYDLVNFKLDDYDINNFDKPIQSRGIRTFNSKGNTKHLDAWVNGGG